MLCDLCGKKEATIHLTQVLNEGVKKIHLCEDCAAESGLDLKGPVSLTNILFGLGAQKASDSNKTSKKICPNCRMRFSDFKKTSRFGCETCYATFAEELEPLLEAIHKGKLHKGKRPLKVLKPAYVTTNLPALKQRLQEAISTENYEEAARIRDEILEQNKKRAAPKQ